MTTRHKLAATALFSILTFGGLSLPIFATEQQITCTPVYGGGEICGTKTYTPAPTGADTAPLLYASFGLYSMGLSSFVLSQKIGRFIPKK